MPVSFAVGIPKIPMGGKKRLSLYIHAEGPARRRKL